MGSKTNNQTYSGVDYASQYINLNNIKLIIWDLDDTFWNGTLSENNSNIKLIKENIKLIKHLCDYGIMNSICSKNNLEQVKSIFIKNGLSEIWECFVFPSINWDSKGKRIKEIISKIQLREENILFIDDNKLNIAEAKYYCPNIYTCFPDYIPNLILQSQNLTKLDIEHKRLKRYKILEQKNRQINNFNSNATFLYTSNIKVKFNSDCKNHVDRILELINRTNQLNYTKVRLDEQQVKELLNNKKYENKYITVCDRFGDYGICGFYSLDRRNNSLIHFLFSCSIMSMGVEQYVYSCLNYPNLSVKESVSVNLEKNKRCGWINQSDITENNHSLKTNDHNNNKYKILLKGPCDLRGVVDYILSDSENFNIDISHFTLDFSFLDSNGYRTDAANMVLNIANSHKLKDELKEKILNDAQFVTRELYNQSIYNDTYDIIIYSLLLDTRSKIYLHKETHEKIAWKQYKAFTDIENFDYYKNFREEGAQNVWTEKQLKDYINKFECLGFMSTEEIIENIEYIINSVSKKTKWIFLIGSDVKPSKEQFASAYWYRECWERRKVQNPKLIKYFKNKKNVKVIEYSKLISSNQDYLDCMDHFTRIVYYRIAKEIAKLIKLFIKLDIVKTHSSGNNLAYIFIKKILATIIAIKTCL